MKGQIVGIAVFLLVVTAVGIAAVGAVSQAYTDSAPVAIAGMPVNEFSADVQATEPEEPDGMYRAFTYVCPFH